jgi:hydroxyacylglutathione hydrolase
METLPKKIIPLRAFGDNYIWMIIDEITSKAFVVDPGDANPVIKALEHLSYTLGGILITHHHWDHSSGIDALLEYAGPVPVIGSHRSSISTIDHPVKEGSEVTLSNIEFQVMEIPGHTLDHIAFYIDSVLIFCGDTLFSAGCGKIFEGTPEMMYDSLNKILQLNEKTQLYCGHEYTLANLNFAQVVEPDNHHINDRIKLANRALQTEGCTLPSSLQQEKLFNPFLRCAIPNVIRATENYSNKRLNNPVDIFHCLRNWKNQF